MKPTQFALLSLSLMLILSLTACARGKLVCPPDADTPKPALQLDELLAMTPIPNSPGSPITVEIKGQEVAVDKVVDYPLCNDNWHGVVYVSCDAQVAVTPLDADENPLFLKGCNLNIAPNTIVYVAAHNDAPYYKGCSCHTGEDPNY
jgi:hypothetical protein